MAVEPGRVILLPGLNGDARVFARQRSIFPDARRVSWPPPRPAELLADYARRLAESLAVPGPCLLVGVSFGGIVAQELARFVDARCCVVIASSRGAAGLPLPLRVARSVASIVPRSTLATAVLVVPMPRRLSERSAFARWAAFALLTWRPVPPSCRVVQIHGDRDATFPAGRATADHVVAGAGHLVTVTHAGAVNAILRDLLTPPAPVAASA